MNPDDVLPDEMEGSIRRVNDLDPLDGTDAADLALFAEDLRTAFPEAPLPERVAEDHIAAMTGAIQLLADKGESALEPTSNAYGPDLRASGLPKLRKRTMKKMLISVAVTAAMLASLGGLAHAGVLPEPIQGAVGSVLGIDDEGDQGNIDDGAVRETNDGAVGDVDDGDQGNVDEGAVGNTDDGGQGNGGQGNVSNGGQGNGGQGNVSNGGQGNGGQGNVSNGGQGNGGQGNVSNGGQGNGGQGNVSNGGQGNGGQGNVSNGGQGNGGQGNVSNGGQGNGGQGNVSNGGQGNGGQGNGGNGGQGNGGQGNVGNGGQGMDRSRAASSLLRGSAGRRRAPDEAWRDRGSLRVPSATSRSRRHA